MKNTFSDYPETPDVTLGTVDTNNKDVKKSNSKKILKQLKKQNKMLKRFIESQQYEEQKKYDQYKTEDNNTTKSKVKSFFEKLGDAIVKAAPVILTTVATAIVNSIFRGNVSHRRTRFV